MYYISMIIKLIPLVNHLFSNGSLGFYVQFVENVLYQGNTNWHFLDITLKVTVFNSSNSRFDSMSYTVRAVSCTNKGSSEVLKLVRLSEKKILIKRRNFVKVLVLRRNLLCLTPLWLLQTPIFQNMSDNCHKGVQFDISNQQM